MNIFRRVLISIVIAALVLFVGMLFWPFIRNNIIEPLAEVIWLLLRILVLSIEQKYFWYAVICVAVIFLFRIMPRDQSTIPFDTYQATNTTLINIGYWRVLFAYGDQDIREEKMLKRELTHLLTSLYESQQNTLNNFGIYDALQNGELPLPEHIRMFLFAAEPQESCGPINRFFQSIQKTPRKWIRQWTGQEKAEHYRMINEVLHFLETSLEIKNDNRNFIQTEH